jgi:RNA polymerase sigma-70 factor (sigma-E family)
MHELPADTEAFRQFVHGSQARVVRFADLVCGNRDRAEDLAQDAYAKAFANWQRIRDGQPEAYVRRCIVNASNDWWRRGRWREGPTADIADRPATSDRPSETDQRADVMRALAALTARERSVIALRYYADLTEAETASELRCAIGTVKSTTARALAKLRERGELREGVS